MADDSKSGTERKALFGEHDRLELGIREQVRTWIERVVQEELTAVSGADSSLRVGDSRRGYRHGTRERTLTRSLGPTTFTLPRARLFTERERRLARGAAGGVADAGGAAVHGPQAQTPRGEGAEAPARGVGRGLPPDGLRRERRRWSSSCSRSCGSRGRSGGRCARPTRWNGSTKSSDGGPRRKRVSRARTPSCCYCPGCCAAGRFGCGRSTGGRRCGFIPRTSTASCPRRADASRTPARP
jgi:hypothetical protein